MRQDHAREEEIRIRDAESQVRDSEIRTDNQATDIRTNVETLRARIAAAAKKSGRGADDILLLAVTKTRTAAEIAMAVKTGIFDLGENKVQEMTNKIEELKALSSEMDVKKCINWHMIGHLQRNKVKYIMRDVALIHSVDSLRLAEEINLQAGLHGRSCKILIQVNPAAEESKFGVPPEDAESLIDAILADCPQVTITGLMCVAPASDNPDELRPHFRRMKALYDDLNRAPRSERLNMEVLSMGMTHDFETAIEEGSNLVRVGTGIFGARDYTNG